MELCRDRAVAGQRITAYTLRLQAGKGIGVTIRKLYYGDNAVVMKKHVKPETVDLVYLDPPFNSAADYNLLFKEDGLSPDEAQLHAFKDTWIWDTAAAEVYLDVQNLPNARLVDLVNALRSSFGKVPMMAYLVHMALRLHMIHESLKPTGSMYMHCDPKASHYLKMILDAIFGPAMFRSEIIWRRTGAHNKARRWAPIHDVILFYTKSDTFTWNKPKQPYMNGHVKEHFKSDGKGGWRTNYYGNVLTGSGTRKGFSGQPWKGIDPTPKGRHWAIPGAIWEEVGIDPEGMNQHEKLDLLYDEGFITIDPNAAWPMYEMAVRAGQGPAMSDIWSFQPYTEGTVYGSMAGIDEDVRWLGTRDQERLGYPTQKPVGLMKRIIAASSNKGDLVMDPFCGCGTTIEAAEILERQWVGIDISPFAIQLIRRRRIEGAFPHLKFGIDYQIDGLPTSMTGAKQLADQDKKAFEVWAVAAVDGLPNPKKGADGGIDGRLKFKPDGKHAKHAIVSVKGGELKADDIRSLIAIAHLETASSEGFGVLISLKKPTPKMRADATAAGFIELGGSKYQKVQFFSIEEILAGKKPRLPFPEMPEVFKKSDKAIAVGLDV